MLLPFLLILFGPLDVLRAEPPHPSDAPPLIDTRPKPSVTEALKAEAEARKQAEADRKARVESLKREAEARKAAAKKQKADKRKAAVKKAAEAKKRLADVKKASGKGLRDDRKANAETARLAALAAQKPLIEPVLLGITDADAPALRPPAGEPSGQAQPRPASLDLESGLEPASGKKRIPLEVPAQGASTDKPGEKPAASPTPAKPEKQAKHPAKTDEKAVPTGTSPATGKWQALGNLFNPFYDEAAVKPVSYSPLPGIAIFPVMRHGGEKAFGDLPLLFASEYAGRLALKIPDTRIYNPVYTVESIRLRGLGHIYDQIMNYYRKAGQPEPAATAYLLKQIEEEGKAISRLVFVEANLDTNRPDAATGLLERVAALMTDGTPKSAKMLVRSRVQIFDVENPSLPMVWANSWQRAVPLDRVRNVTSSVYDDSDSEQTFAAVSRQMSRELIYVMPKTAYMVPVYDASVRGRLAERSGSPEPSGMAPVSAAPAETIPFPNLSESPRPPLSEENQRIIQRILQPRNAISP
jgi:hypothetical protein